MEDVPRQKRLKTRPTSQQDNSTPRLFAPFRALGFVTNHVPPVLQVRTTKGSSAPPRIHIVTCINKSWAMWEGDKMSLLFVGPDANDPIASLALDGDFVWASTGRSVIKYGRGKAVSRLTNPLGTPLATILIFGSQLVSLTADGMHLFVWDIETGAITCKLGFDPGFTASHVLHPATYLNKILVASRDGAMQLWNIQTRECIHRFESSNLRGTSNDRQPCTLTCLAQSPAIDIVGIGFSSGEVTIFDIRADEKLLQLRMEGCVRSIGFRADGEPVLATASSTGHLALWDLQSGGRLLHLTRDAHDGAITSVQWIPGQPLLVSSAEDNSVKQWLFDSPTAPPRLLKLRSGHHSPPHLVRYYGSDGKQILTAARDRSLRCTSIVKDSRSFELSQGPLNRKSASLALPVFQLKFPTITSLSFSSARSNDWDDVLTSHVSEPAARTWTVREKKLGRWTFSSSESNSAEFVTAVCVTDCGNFGLVGTSVGHIQMWNMQSGLKRKAFICGPLSVPTTQSHLNAKDSITGLATDSLNQSLIATRMDGTLNFFDFHTAKLHYTLILPASPMSFVLQKDSGLLAVTCDDLCVRIFDIGTRKLVRELRGFGGRILDVTLSPDSRWLVVASMDSIIRTFDIPTGHLIDAFQTPSVASSLSFSPVGDFLATSHVDSVGIHLWANKAQYGEVSYRSPIANDVPEVDLPSVQGVNEGQVTDFISGLALAEEGIFTSPPQLEGDLVTLTVLPRSRWRTLLNFDIIQQRNRPKEAPKAPEKVPFFLPTLPGVEPRFLVDEKKTAASNPKTSTPIDPMMQGTTMASSILTAELTNGNFERFFSYMISLSPAAADMEIRMLTDLQAMRAFLMALTRRLTYHRDFEAVQAFMTIFLRIHGDRIIDDRELRESLEKLLELQRGERDRLVDLISSSLGTLAFVRKGP